MRAKLILVGALAVILLAGCNGVPQKTHDAFVRDYEMLQRRMEKLQSDYDALKEDYYRLKSEYDQYKKDIAPFMDLANLENEKTRLKQDIAELEAKIEELNADVIKIAGKPKTYPAGYLYAGKDFPAGRYKIYGGSSNFFVYDVNDRIRVNIILGRLGVDEYIYTFSEGEEIRAKSSFKLVPVE